MSEPLLLLDTHVWLWLAAGQKGSMKPRTIAAIEQAAQLGSLRVSIISVWEIAVLTAKGRIVLPLSVSDWMTQALRRPEIRLLTLERPALMIDSCNLPGDFHADPADRLLVATARAENAILATRDEKILAYGKAGHVQVMAV